MSYYAVPPEGIGVMQEQIQDLEDCLDAAQERADEWQRIGVMQEQIQDLEDCLDAAQERADEWQRIGVNLFWELFEADNKRANSIWWDEPTLQEELPTKFFKNEPGKCIWEVLADGNVYCKRLESYPVCYLRRCDAE